MKTSASFLTLTVITILLLAPPVNMMPLHNDTSDSSNSSTTAPIPGQHFSLSGFTKTVSRLVGAMQTIWGVLSNHVSMARIMYIDSYNNCCYREEFHHLSIALSRAFLIYQTLILQ